MSKRERPSEIVVNAGLRLRAAREQLGLTQAVLARELGVGPTAVTNWEKGDRLVDVLAMVRFFQRFGITLEWIYAGQLRSLPYDVAQDLEAWAAKVGAVVGAPAAEWPMQVLRLPGLERERAPGRVPRKRPPHRLNEPSPRFGSHEDDNHNT